MAKIKADIGAVTVVVMHILFIANYLVMLDLDILIKVYLDVDSVQHKSFESGPEVLPFILGMVLCDRFEEELLCQFPT
ncbi:hypothetical protein [Sulfurovum sp.]|uniref:hypothetical protein n=1 Tax=Sulfurovum sp. TaxID=1969726 RepID=UPI003567BA4A